MLPEQEYSRLRETLRRAVANSCRGWLVPYLDDVVQDALVRILKKLHKGRRSLEGNDPLSASYLWKVAHNCLVDEIRRRERRLEKPIEETKDAAEMESPDPGPDRNLASKAILQGLEDCLAELAEEKRRALVLHMVGHTVPETAKILGWDEKQTDNFTYRGRIDLRQCLKGKGITP